MAISPFNSMMNSVYASRMKTASQRVMRFIGRWGKIYEKTENEDIGGNRAVSALMPYANVWTDNIRSLWQTSGQRKQVHKLMDRMCNEEDGPISAGIDAIVDAALGPERYNKDDDEASDPPPFKVVILETPGGISKEEAEEHLHNAFDNAGVYNLTPQIIRNMLIFGESYHEVVVTANNDPELVELKNITSWAMWPNRHKEFGHRIKGYTYNDGAKSIEFKEHQITHFVHRPNEYDIGKPLLYEERRNWNRIATNEDSIAIDRYLRAHPKLEHKIPIPDGASPQTQMEMMKFYRMMLEQAPVIDLNDNSISSVNAHSGVSTDLFTPRYINKSQWGDSKIQTYEGAVNPIEFQFGQLDNLNDINYAYDKVLSRLNVPRRFINMQSDRAGALTESGLELEDMHFARVVRNVQREFKGDNKHGIRKLANVLLMYEYGTYSGFKFKIEMAKVNVVDERDKAAVQAVQISTLATLAGIPDEIIPHEWALKYSGIIENEAQMKEFLSLREKAEKKAEEKRKKEMKETAALAPPMKSSNGQSNNGRIPGVTAKGNGSSKDPALQRPKQQDWVMFDFDLLNDGHALTDEIFKDVDKKIGLTDKREKAEKARTSSKSKKRGSETKEKRRMRYDKDKSNISGTNAGVN